MFNVINSAATTVGVIAILVIIFILLVATVSGIRVVKQTDKYVIERLGGYYNTWGIGIHFLVPFFDRVAAKISLKEQVKDFEPQPVITRDNVTMLIDTVVFFQVTDPKLYCYGVDRPVSALENLSATTLRNIIGELDLDQTLTSRDIINTKMRMILDEATDPWGIKVNRVEVKNITPPKDIRDAMEKQMRAEREKREAVLRAQGEKEAAILTAQGEKESNILKAEGQKEQMIRLAEGEKQKLINLAQGQAEALRINKEAEALGIELVKNAKADNAVLTLKSLETLCKVSEGQATKIIIPSEIQNLAGLVTSFKEIAENDLNNNKSNK